jgi:Mn2+/Fe2+ NRAMP family transporter
MELAKHAYKNDGRVIKREGSVLKMNRETVKKILAFTVCVLFIVVTLLSASFVLTYSHHDHDHDGPGGNCATCAHLTVAGKLLKLFAGALVCTAFCSGVFAAICSALKPADFHAALFTLVHQKIKLNN